MAGWNPINSAASGAALAGVLAALVIAVSIQIAVQASRDRRDQSMSLKASAPTLVTLLVAAYLYVVLDGIPSSTTEVADALLLTGEPTFRDPSALAMAVGTASSEYAHLAARGFAISGSVLALGALMTLFIVVASIFDNTGEDKESHTLPGEREARLWALGVFRAAIATIIAILAMGYRVGISSVGRTVQWDWWVWQTAFLSAPTAAVAVWVLLQDRELRSEVPEASEVADIAPRARPTTSDRDTGKYWPTLAVGFVAALPTVVTLILVTAGPDNSQWAPLDLTIAASGIYYGISAAFLLWLVERRNISDEKRARSAQAEHSSAA